METNLFPCVFSSEFVVPDMDLSVLAENVPRMRAARILPEYLVAPVFVLWDLTYRCNLHCAYCYNSSGPREPMHELDRDALFRLADDLASMKLFSVCLSGGEPIMRAEFLELARYLRDREVVVSTITNGYDITADVAHEMSEVMSLVQVSLDGASAKTHDRLRGKGSFERVLTTIGHLKDAGVPQVRVSALARHGCVDDLPELLKLCLDLGVDDLRAMPPIPSGRAYSRDDLSPDTDECTEMGRLMTSWAQDPDLAHQISVEWGDPVHHVRLGLMLGFLIGVNITADGFFRFCPYVNVAMGNATDMSLSEAWERGLRTAWKHPFVEQEMRKLNTFHDYRDIFQSSRVVGRSECLDLLAC